MKQRHFHKTLFFLTGSLLLLFIVNISLGSVAIPFTQLIKSLFGNADETYSAIVWQFRLPKAVTCLLAGGVLAVSGLLMQTLFRNPLAGPDVLGLSSGASLMVAVVLLAGQSFFGFLLMSPWSVAIAASIGSAFVFLIILMIARYVKDSASLLIIGLMMSAATSSIVGVLQYLSKAEDLQVFMIWTMGSMGSTNWPEIALLALLTLIGVSIAVVFMKSLNGWLLGDHYAKSIGISVSRSRFWIVTATSLMTGGVTAFCGPVAFVGLAVPHLIRLIIPTTNHKVLIPAVFLGGALLLLFCDVIAQLPGSTQLLPLNAITSIIGAPVVIWMVIRNKQIRM